MLKLFLTFFILLFTVTTSIGADMEKRKTIMIDLDGVLNTYDGNFRENCIPEPKGGAKEFVQKLNKDYDLVLFTSRNSLEASRWLTKNEMDKYFKNVTNVKIPAYIYLDDRAIVFNGDYEKTMADIEKFKVYWK